MKTTAINICRSLISELRWNERYALKNARIAASKAIWLGLDKQEVLDLIGTVPSASYLRQCPHIFHETWTAVNKTNPNEFTSEFEQLLNAV